MRKILQKRIVLFRDEQTSTRRNHKSIKSFDTFHTLTKSLSTRQNYTFLLIILPCAKYQTPLRKLLRDWITTSVKLDRAGHIVQSEVINARWRSTIRVVREPYWSTRALMRDNRYHVTRSLQMLPRHEQVFRRPEAINNWKDAVSDK